MRRTSEALSGLMATLSISGLSICRFLTPMDIQSKIEGSLGVAN